MRAFEDFTIGETAAFGPLEVTAQAIRAFAAQFDPQPMHLEGAAQNAILSGLFASGMHTACMHMRLFADGILHDSTSMGRPGVEEVRYLAPVRPGDRLTLRLEVLDARPSKSRPEMGIVKFRSHMVNQDGKAALQMTSTLLFGRRPAAGQESPP
jgi:acyl dehydratase